MFKLFFRRRQRFITNMWNSFWWWRDRFNSEVQLKDRIGWEGNIKNSLLNCQWRSVSHVWLVTEFNWVVKCCRSWVGFYRFILLTPIFGRNTRKIIHLNIIIILCENMPSGWPVFNVWLKKTVPRFCEILGLICVRQFITKSTESGFS